MANRVLTIEVPEEVFAAAVEALWFNGGAQADVDHFVAAQGRLRNWLREEKAAYEMAQFDLQQRAARETHKATVDEQLDQAGDVLTINVQ